MPGYANDNLSIHFQASIRDNTAHYIYTMNRVRKLASPKRLSERNKRQDQ